VGNGNKPKMSLVGILITLTYKRITVCTQENNHLSCVTTYSIYDISSISH